MKLLTQLFEFLRYTAFWILDMLKGFIIKKHLKEIKTVLENSQSSRAIEIRQNHLQSIINHAISTTGFYKNIKHTEYLNEFPVINKNILNNNKSDFISSKFANKKNKTVSTSGSTGAALILSLDRNKVARNSADTIYFSQLAGFKIGYRLFFIRHWNTYYKKGKLLSWFQNITPIEVLNLSDSTIYKFINKIKKDPSTKGFLGYASAFEQISKYLERTASKPLKANVKSIIAISEHLDEHTKASIQKFFNVPVVSRYSNTENGIIAQQKANDPNFVINWASYYVEILNLNDDTPSNKGDIGRIVITDLFNYCNPLIRYDTGDIGCINFEASPPSFTKIEGRKTDIIYNTKGQIVSSFIIIDLLKYSQIKQSQLIQENKKEYTLKLNTSKEGLQEDLIIKEFKSYLGKDAMIRILYVDEIPLLASGKRKQTLNNWMNSTTPEY